jgi:hypothetical protein
MTNLNIPDVPTLILATLTIPTTTGQSNLDQVVAHLVIAIPILKHGGNVNPRDPVQTPRQRASGDQDGVRVILPRLLAVFQNRRMIEQRGVVLWTDMSRTVVTGSPTARVVLPSVLPEMITVANLVIAAMDLIVLNIMIMRI